MITAEELKKHLSYNPETGVFLRLTASGGKSKVGHPAGFLSDMGYLCIGINRKTYKAHRLAFLYVNGEWPIGDIDHINGIKNDNRITNLRDVSHQVNGFNQRNAHSHSKSGILGVHWDQRTQKWRAQIKLHGKKKHLGLFQTAEEAHSMYLQTKRNHHSEGFML